MPRCHGWPLCSADDGLRAQLVLLASDPDPVARAAGVRLADEAADVLRVYEAEAIRARSA